MPTIHGNQARQMVTLVVSALLLGLCPTIAVNRPLANTALEGIVKEGQILRDAHGREWYQERPGAPMQPYFTTQDPSKSMAVTKLPVDLPMFLKNVGIDSMLLMPRMTLGSFDVLRCVKLRSGDFLLVAQPHFTGFALMRLSPRFEVKWTVADFPASGPTIFDTAYISRFTAHDAHELPDGSIVLAGRNQLGSAVLGDLKSHPGFAIVDPNGKMTVGPHKGYLRSRPWVPARVYDMMVADARLIGPDTMVFVPYIDDPLDPVRKKGLVVGRLIRNSGDTNELRSFKLPDTLSLHQARISYVDSREIMVVASTRVRGDGPWVTVQIKLDSELTLVEMCVLPTTFGASLARPLTSRTQSSVLYENNVNGVQRGISGRSVTWGICSLSDSRPVVPDSFRYSLHGALRLPDGGDILYGARRQTNVGQASAPHADDFAFAGGIGNEGMEWSFVMGHDSLDDAGRVRFVYPFEDGSLLIMGQLPLFRDMSFLAKLTPTKPSSAVEESLLPLNAYPNPLMAGDMLTVQAGIGGLCTVELVSSTGQRVWYEAGRNVDGPLQLELPALASGVYSLRISNGVQTAVTQVVRL